MRLRVVCGFEVTIATFCPTNRFSSVDFPAFGRPMMATNPARRFLPLVASFLTDTIPLTLRWGDPTHWRARHRATIEYERYAHPCPFLSPRHPHYCSSSRPMAYSGCQSQVEAGCPWPPDVRKT